MTYDAMDIARYVVNYCIDICKPISNLKLQKILYYIQAAFLFEKSEPCFDDVISRWRHGPVVIDVYNQFSRFIGKKIDEPQEYYIDYEFNKNLKIQVVKKKFKSNIINKEDQLIINNVVNGLIDINPWRLVERTHEEDPWKDTESNEEITVQSIKDYFTQNDKNGDRIYGRS